MVLLVLHDALSVLLGDQGAYTVAMLTVRLRNLINHMHIKPD
jgi:hypothetical protein